MAFLYNPKTKQAVPWVIVIIFMIPVSIFLLVWFYSQTVAAKSTHSAPSSATNR